MREIRYTVTVEMADFFQKIAQAAKETTDLNQRIQILTESLKNFQQRAARGVDVFKAFQEYAQKVSGGMEAFAGVSKEAFQAAISAGHAQEAFISKTKSGFETFKDVIASSKGPLKDFVDLLRGDATGAVWFLARVFNAIVYTGLYSTIALQFYSIVNAIQEATRRAYEFSEAIFRINNAASALREAGVDVTAKGLFGMVGQLREDLGALAEAIPTSDLLTLVSSVAIMTQQMRLSEEEIYRLVRAIVILNRASAETETVLSTARKVISSLITSGRGIGSLGISFSEKLMRERAMELGFIKRPEEFGRLTQEQIYRVKFEILTEEAEKKARVLGDAFEYPSIRADVMKTKISDALTAIGKVFSSLYTSFPEAANTLATLLHLFAELLKYVGMFVIMIEKGVEGIILLGYHAVRIQTFLFSGKPLEGVRDFLRDLLDLRERFLDAERQFLVGAEPEQLLKGTEELPALGQVFTALGDAAQEGAGDVESALKTIESDIGALLDLYDRMRREREDFMIRVRREEEDFARRLADLDADYRRRIEEAENESNDRRQDLIERFNLWLIAEEERKNEQLRQLRERFLLDLEDAVRRRDAVAIIRGTKQYLMERQNIINEFNLRVAERRRMLEYELAQVREEVNQRIAELMREWAFRRKQMIEEHNIKMARMREDHEREMAELRRQIINKIMEIAQGIARELQLRQQGMNLLYMALLRYLGPGGLIDNLYQHSVLSATNAANRIIENIRRILSAIGSLRGGSFPNLPSDIGGQAQGGIYLATKPTRAVFGEAGPELAIFLPLSKSVPPATSRFSLGFGGRASLEIFLDRGLRGSLVDDVLQNIDVQLKRWKGVGP